jgi:hypothetical protein
MKHYITTRYLFLARRTCNLAFAYTDHIRRDEHSRIYTMHVDCYTTGSITHSHVDVAARVTKKRRQGHTAGAAVPDPDLADAEEEVAAGVERAPPPVERFVHEPDAAEQHHPERQHGVGHVRRQRRRGVGRHGHGRRDARPQHGRRRHGGAGVLRQRGHGRRRRHGLPAVRHVRRQPVVPRRRPPARVAEHQRELERRGQRGGRRRARARARGDVGGGVVQRQHGGRGDREGGVGRAVHDVEHQQGDPRGQEQDEDGEAEGADRAPALAPAVVVAVPGAAAPPARLQVVGADPLPPASVVVRVLRREVVLGRHLHLRWLGTFDSRASGVCVCTQYD